MRGTPSQWLAAGAAVATVALTVAAFWLSYEHLHDVAVANGLRDAPARAWAWPATVDLFIVAGELLILRAALAGKADPWAIALAATGSVGSIALNVAGVGMGAPMLTYVVAAVPPVAALLAFGALMRQVHDALSNGAGQTALSTAETPADQAFPAIAETGADQPFSRIRENAPAVGHGHPLTGTGASRGGTATTVRDSRSLTAVRDGASLTEGQADPLSVERDTLSLSVGSLGDLTNGEGTHPASTPGDLRGAAKMGLHSVETLTTDEGVDHVGGAATKGVQTVHTPEVPSAVVTERAFTATDTPGDYRIGTPSGGVALADFIDGPVYPEPVPAAYPAEHERVRLDFLPLPDRPRATMGSGPTVAAEPPRTRLQVDAEYVPEDGREPGTEESEDDLTARARAEFTDRLAGGKVPPIREIRAVLAVGQDRAKRVQDVLRRDAENGVRA